MTFKWLTTFREYLDVVTFFAWLVHLLEPVDDLKEMLASIELDWFLYQILLKYFKFKE